MDLGQFELCLKVKDLDASRRFYEKLGFEAVRGDRESPWVLLKGSSLTLALYHGHIESNLLNFRGVDVFAVSKEIAERGIVFEKLPTVEADTVALDPGLKTPMGTRSI